MMKQNSELREDEPGGVLGAIAGRLQRPARGFTLVELMIAMALVGMLTAIIYGVFSRTSDSLHDVEGMTEALDRARFGLAHVRNDLQAAGSQSTPNSEIDPWVQPAAPNKIVAVAAYTEWQQDSASFVPSELSTANPMSEFSGIVVMGAFDFPQSFFLSNLQGGVGLVNQVGFDIRGNERGLGRLTRADPFNVQAGDVAVDITRISQNMENRLLRLSDGKGFYQFAPVTDPENAVPSIAGPFQFRSPGQVHGLNPYAESDVDFTGAFIDAYWYRVRVDPQDENNFQLVRERLHAGNLIAANVDTLSESALDGVAVDNSATVIVDNVVDFRVWFECADGMGQVSDMTRDTGWDISAYGDCMASGATLAQHRARIAHIRLSVRTPHENANRPHLQVVAGWPGFEEENGAMITYDLAPDARGSASVVTVQGSVELTNLAMRGL